MADPLSAECVMCRDPKARVLDDATVCGECYEFAGNLLDVLVTTKGRNLVECIGLPGVEFWSLESC
jgi:hypothetical protein